MLRAAAFILLGLAAASGTWAQAPGRAVEGIKRPGPVPYVELFGRKAVKPRKPAHRPTSVKRAASSSPSGTAPTPRASQRPPTPAPAQAVVAAGAPPAARPPSAAQPSPAPRPQPTAALPPAPLPPPPRLGAALDAAAAAAFVDGAVGQARAAAPLHGVVVAVVQDGAVLVEKGYGPVDPRATLFRLGSVSKALTWIAALKAVEEGRLKLDAPIDGALPAPLRPPPEGFRKPITLRLLMEHAAGFESREFGRLYRLDADALLPLDAALRRDRPRRVRAPGDLSSYSSYDAALAGAMVAQAFHAPFDTAVAREVTAPLHMASTTFAQPYPADPDLPPPMPDALAARLATGHAMTPHGLRALPFEFARLTPALAASSTADDMARLMLAILGDGRAPGADQPVLGPGTLAALTGRAPGWAEGSGGLMRVPLAGGLVGFGHDGATLGFRARLLVVPAMRLGVFVAGDSDSSEALVRRLPEQLVARFAPAAPPVPPSVASNSEAGQAAGLYLSTRRAYHGLEGFVDRLTRLYRVRAAGDGGVIVSDSRGVRAYGPAAQAGVFAAADGGGAQLRAVADRAGAVTTLSEPGGFVAAERVGWLHAPATLAVAAAAALLAGLLSLAGLFVRNDRDLRQTPVQTQASILQTATALLWLAAVGAFAVFAGDAADPVRLYTAWPDPWLVAASWLALAAGVATLGAVVQLPYTWPEARRIQGWGGWRKLRHALTVLCFAAFTAVLAAWGALEPWSS